ncbi:30S ribosomal protein S11 [Candidatus Peregrinibacteria bacterium RIFOXYB2_FULL_32_7]|nr:MAG: 30S ribosomal protein S11 [Candidatus Peregrinibacteria bacterium RIFOXYB2_FULL_32_7]
MSKKVIKKMANKTKKIHVPEGKVYIGATFNNTIVTITDLEGKTIAWASAGACGFKGTRQSTPYAGQVASETAAEKAQVFGLEKAHIFVKGVGPGREQAMRGLNSKGLNILSITDITPMPHNGCRRSRSRRV